MCGACVARVYVCVRVACVCGVCVCRPCASLAKGRDIDERRQYGKDILELPELLFELNTMRPMLKLLFSVLEPPTTTGSDVTRSPAHSQLNLTEIETGKVKLRLRTALQISAVLYHVASDSAYARSCFGYWLQGEDNADLNRAPEHQLQVWRSLVQVLTLWKHPMLVGGTPLEPTHASSPSSSAEMSFDGGAGLGLSDGALLVELLLDVMQFLTVLIHRVKTDSPEAKGQVHLVRASAYTARAQHRQQQQQKHVLRVHRVTMQR